MIVHVCSKASQVETLLNRRPYSRPTPTFVLVSIEATGQSQDKLQIKKETNGLILDNDESFLRRHRTSADNLYGFDLLRHVNLFRKYQKIQRVMTASCLHDIDPNSITRSFDIGCDEYIHMGPEIDEIARLSLVRLYGLSRESCNAYNIDPGKDLPRLGGPSAYISATRPGSI